MNDYTTLLFKVYEVSRVMIASQRSGDYDTASAMAIQLSQLYRQLELLKTENAEGMRAMV